MTAILACMCWALASAADLPPATDLQADARASRQSGAPVLVLYSQADCPWCERARREYLLPMSRAAHHGTTVQFRQIDLDSDRTLVDFDGRASTHRRFARSQKITVTPTLVLYGPCGERLDAAIVGMRLADFYGQYIEQSIESAREKLMKTAR